jgi:methionine-R-sulfoxide reductase
MRVVGIAVAVSVATGMGVTGCQREGRGRADSATESPAAHATNEAAAVPPESQARVEPTGATMSEKLDKSEAEWKKQLTPEQYHVLREKGTERAFSGKYWNTKDKGTYKCAGCGAELFKSDTKFDSGCGWPSFYESLDKSAIEEHIDLSHGMRRIEVTCRRCGGHLGHVFDDGPRPTGLRYCINSVSIDFMPAGKSSESATSAPSEPAKK